MTVSESVKGAKFLHFFRFIGFSFPEIFASFKTQNQKKRMYQSPLYGTEQAWRNVKNEVRDAVLISG